MSYLEYNLGHPAPSLKSAWPIAKEALRDFATGPNFWANLETAFGNDLDSQKAAALAAEWGAGDFSGLPEIEVRPGGEINGAMGAFSGDTNTIYFSQEYLSANAGNGEAVAGVWLEEVGHFVDSVVNSEDAAGDEGEIFSRLVRGDVLSGLELELLRGEDDGATVVLDGVERAIEMAALKFGVPVSAELSVVGESDSYTFTGKAGDQVFVNAVGADIKSEVRIFRPDGTLLGERDGILTGTKLNLQVAPDVDGTYTVLFDSDSGTQTGDYSLNVERTNSPAKPTSIKFGQPISASLERASELDSYTFTAKAGDQVFVNAVGADIKSEVRIFRPDGTLLGERDGILTGTKLNLQVAPDVDGTYTVLFDSDSGTQTGDYSLNVERTNSPAKPTSIKFGQPISASLERASELDSYTFTGKAGDQVFVNAVGADIKSEVRIFRPDGTLLGERDGILTGTKLNLQVAPDVDGTYTVLFDSDSGTQTGDYSLNVERTNSPAKPTSIKFGQPISASLERASELDSYTFTAKAGNQIFVNAVGADIKSEVRIFRPDGTLLGERDGILTGSELNLQVAPDVDGTYTVLFDSDNGTQIGDYTLNVECIGECKTEPEPKPKPPNTPTTGTNKKDNLKGSNKKDNINGKGGNDKISGGGGNDKLNGGGGKDNLNGGRGKDNLIGGKGNDVLNGGKGADTLKGGPGNDIYFIDNTRDRVIEIFGGSATGGSATATARGDTVNTSVSVTATGGSATGGSASISQFVENIKLTGKKAINATAGKGNNDITGNRAKNVINAGSGNDKVNGGGGNDKLDGGKGKDNLIGGKGNDILDGGKGPDKLKGGPGSDTYFIDHIGDIVIEPGTATHGTATATATGDTVSTSVSVSAGSTSKGSAQISQFVENIILTGKKAINATAGKGSNDITGNSANNIINAGSGNDIINAGGGNDIINAGGGNDRVNGDGANDIINGGSGNDNISGNGGNDIINGGSGNDTLIGGSGNDILNGGSGKDRFLYQSNRRFRSQDFGKDKIARFVTGEDDIVLDKTTFNSLESKAGNGLVKNDFATITGKASAATSSAEIVYNSSTGELFYNANGSAAGFGGGGKFATLTNEPALSRSDFMVQN